MTSAVFWAATREKEKTAPLTANQHTAHSTVSMTTTRYTESEWRAMISEVARELEVYEQDYCPDIDKIDIARTIDHTLLKLDATPKQIDELCAEARVANFAVTTFFPSLLPLVRHTNTMLCRAFASDLTMSPKRMPISKEATS